MDFQDDDLDQYDPPTEEIKIYHDINHATWIVPLICGVVVIVFLVTNYLIIKGRN